MENYEDFYSRMFKFFYGKVKFSFLAFIWEEFMDFVNTFKQVSINTVKQVSIRAFFFCIKGQDHPSIFNQCLSNFDSIKLTGLSK